MSWLTSIAGFVSGNVLPVAAIAGFTALAGVAVYTVHLLVDGAYERGLTEAQAQCVAEQAEINADAQQRIVDAVARHSEIMRKGQQEIIAAERRAAKAHADLAASRAAHDKTLGDMAELRTEHHNILRGACVPGCQVELPH